MSVIRICPDLDRECGMQQSWCATCPNRATLPAAPAPTEQATDFLMPEDAWNEYATRSGLLNEHGVAPDPAKTQIAYFAYQAAWNRCHKAFSEYIAARQAPAEAPKDQAATIELLRSTMQRAYDSLASAAMAQTRDGEAAWRAMGTVLNDLSARQAPDSRDAADAARYRHIRDTTNNGFHLEGSTGIGKWHISRKFEPCRADYYFGERLDDKIDSDILAAIAQEKAQ